MHTAWLILGILACPLCMVAFGGLAWFNRRVLAGRVPSLARLLAQRGAAGRRLGADLRTQTRDAADEVATHA